MKIQRCLAAAVLLTSVADCLPQILIPNRTTAKVSVITGGGLTLGDPFTLPTGFTLPPGLTLPPGFTIGTELTRTLNVPPETVDPPSPTSTRKTTTSGVKTTSSSSKIMSATTLLPPTTSSTIKTTSSSRLPPSTQKSSSSTKSSRSTTPPALPTISPTTSSRSITPTPTTKVSSSSTKSTRSTTPAPPLTTSKTTVSTSKTTLTSKSTNPLITQTPTTSKTTPSLTKTSPSAATMTTKPPSSTNPYSATCPIPTSYTINNFISYDGPGGDVALTISYGSAVFTCPNTFAHSSSSNGRFTLDCDDDGLVKIVTDGFSYINVQQKFWCDEVPKPPGSYATLQASANYTIPAGTLFCEIDDINIRTCLQLDPDITIPVQSYTSGGTISFTPLDLEGNVLTQCPTIQSTQPIVQDPAKCGLQTETMTVTQTATETGTQTQTGKGTTSVRFTQTATVVING
ncbi:uncharacterized protein RCO7_06825 [Rhynchosporium graminicola]|uniref:Uncharacterized protein n=1 Tax=Rhynchosporium graminicola TaxID=2792576 RepID=A0A1E1JY36_9HELO|nr:uncharacterized protein RCO7_06825 [Rhynchosporium commune]